MEGLPLYSFAASSPIIEAMTTRAPVPAPDLVSERTLPGLGLAVAGAVVATAVAETVPVLSVAVVAIALGAVVSNLGLIPAEAGPGLAFASKRLLRMAVVLVGLRLSFGDIAEIGTAGLIAVGVTVLATFFGTQVLGRRLGLSADMSLLVATGYAICGVSAIAAMRNATDAEDEEVAAAMGLVTLFGTAAMISLPVFGAMIGLSDAQFAVWAGASVHDVAQVVATASSVGPGVVTTAVAVKLTRVSLLAPVVLGVNLFRARHRRGDGGQPSNTPILPLFVVGFLAMVAVRSSGVVPTMALDGIRDIERWLLAIAMVGLGTGIDVGAFRRLGSRPLLVGVAAWALVAVVALIGALVTA